MTAIGGVASRPRRAALLLLMMLLLLLAACAPDLAPAEVDGIAGPICEQDTVVVTVQNLGTDAPQSITALRFVHRAGEVRVATPAIGTKSHAAIRVPIPNPVPSQDAIRFEMTVDADNTVVESNEANNVVGMGDCTPGIEP